MANIAYNKGLFRMGSYNYDTDAISLGLILVKNTYTFSRLHNFVSDLTPGSNEASGSGYVRKTIAGAARTVNEDDAGNAANFRITNGTVAWTAINAGTDLRVVLFFIDGVDINDDAANPLLGYFDTGTNIPLITNGGNIDLNFNTEGALKLTSP